MISVLFYSLICPLYPHANNSISTIGYLFMRGITYVVIVGWSTWQRRIQTVG